MSPPCVTIPLLTESRAALYKLLKAEAFKLILLQGPSFCQRWQYLNLSLSSGQISLRSAYCCSILPSLDTTSMLEINFRDIRQSPLLWTARHVNCPSKSDGTQVRIFDRHRLSKCVRGLGRDAFRRGHWWADIYFSDTEHWVWNTNSLYEKCFILLPVRGPKSISQCTERTDVWAQRISLQNHPERFPLRLGQRTP